MRFAIIWGKRGLYGWKGSFFDDFLDAEKKKKMKIDGVTWTPLKGHFIPLESAIAQILLRLKVEDFDSRVGPCYKEFPTSGGNVESIRVYNAFNSSKYAIDMQKWVNVLCFDSLYVLCFTTIVKTLFVFVSIFTRSDDKRRVLYFIMSSLNFTVHSEPGLAGC